MEKCDECGKGLMKEKKVDYLLLGQNLGKFDALVCDACNEIIFSGETFSLVEKKAREKGLWRLAAKTRIGTSGNALDVKLPKSIIDFMRLEKGQEVCIEPLDQKRFQVNVLA